jgi:SAM-dependent methyltransferase
MFFTTFGYFSDEENLKVIKEISTVLKPSGVLLIDMWNPVLVMYKAYLYNGRRTSWYEAGGYLILEEAKYDVYNARVNVRRTYLRKDTKSFVGENNFSIRYYTYWELKDLLKRNDLVIEKVYGSYEGEGYEAMSLRLIVVARKQ